MHYRCPALTPCGCTLLPLQDLRPGTSGYASLRKVPLHWNGNMCADAVHVTSILSGDEELQAPVRCLQGAVEYGQGDAPASAAFSSGVGVEQATARDEAGTTSASAEECKRVLEHLQAIKARKLVPTSINDCHRRRAHCTAAGKRTTTNH